MRELETDRLLLRPLTPDDLPWIAELYADPEIGRWLGGTRTRAQAAESLDRMWNLFREQGFGLMAAVEKLTGQCIGRCGYLVQSVEGRQELELAWAIARERWGRGFATEAAAALRDHAFGAMGRERVISLVRPENVASAAVAKKIGMQVEGEVPFRGDVVDLWALAKPS
ncbi:MAG: GNAT family N-acetyltransferase [Deltaproteobacteria bacterium]|nr:GNAT family N-acetyltransferase [Deltaproteobacteria bacterium]